MHRFDVIQLFIEFGETHSEVENLGEKFQKAIEALGFRYFACCSHVDPLNPPPEAIVLHNYPPAWAKTFSQARLYEIDPVLKYAESTLVPFFWDKAFRDHPLTRPQKRMLAEASKYGIAHGYTVPIHLSWLPGTLRASCSVIPDHGHIEREHYIAVELLATYLYIFATRSRIRMPDATPRQLTSRERQCLALVAQGKADWAIARLLGLSESTVHYHVERVKQRFHVSTRMQAVILAFVNGQLSVDDVVRQRTNKTNSADKTAGTQLH